MSEPLALRIKLPFASEEEFIDRYGTNLARGGMFIATKSIKPEGTSIAFELVLANNERILRGEGTVVKAQVDEGGLRRGMTVRFDKLDASSKELVERIVARRSPPPAPEPQPASEPTPPPASPPVAAAPPAPPAATEAPKRRRSLPEIPAVSAPPDVAPILGIDFGATSLRAAVTERGEARLLPLASNGATELPATLYVDEKNQLLAGEEAEKRAAGDPQHAVRGLKKLLGRRARAAGVRGVPSIAVSADEKGDAAVVVRGVPHRAPELAARLLREVVDAASRAVGRELTRAIVCVPAHFTDRQRVALLEAARRAKLQVLRLINEPTAVALAFGHGKGLARKRILVCALGEGGADVCVVEVTGDDVEAVTAGGDTFLKTGEPVERSLELTRATLQAGGLEAKGLDELLVVGALGREGPVRQQVEAALGKPPRVDMDPDAAVALGAALVGHALAEVERGKGRLAVSEVLSAPLCIGVAGGDVRRILERNTRLPAEKSLPFAVHQGETISLAVFQGEAARATDNELLGALHVTAERDGDLALRFAFGANGTLEVFATQPGSKVPTPIELATADLSDDALQALLAKAALPAEQRRPKGLLQRLFGRA